MAIELGIVAPAGGEYGRRGVLFLRDVDFKLEELCRMLTGDDLRGLVGHKAAGIDHHAARLAVGSVAPQHAPDRPTSRPKVEERVRR